MRLEIHSLPGTTLGHCCVEVFESCFVKLGITQRKQSEKTFLEHIYDTTTNKNDT